MNIDERVYGYEPAASQLKELRNEIERLNKRVRDIETERRNLRAAMNLREEDHQRKTAEIERLRVDRDAIGFAAAEQIAEKDAQIERLRGRIQMAEAERDAANSLAKNRHAEIERLRNLFIETAAKHEGVLIKRDDEIEQLRKDFTDLLRLAANDASQYQSEIERLRADRDSWADQADARVKDCVEYIAEIDKLRALLSLWIDMIRLFREGKPVPIDYIEKQIQEALKDSRAQKE